MVTHRLVAAEGSLSCFSPLFSRQIVLFFQDGVCGPVEENVKEVGRITKRHVQPDCSQAEYWDKPKKAKRSREEEREQKAQPAFDTEEDISLCPAEKCLQPEGDEVGILFICIYSALDHIEVPFYCEGKILLCIQKGFIT